MRLRSFLVLTAYFLLAATSTFGQSAPLLGVVWTPPADEDEAAAELLRMRAAGIQGVRTDLITSERLLETADTLGLRLFQELPLAFATTRTLTAALEPAGAQLRSALARAAAHPSARDFGLARHPDTGSPGACSYFEQLARLADEQPFPVRTYYVTRLIEADRCGSAVDYVLLDLRGETRPAQWLLRYRRAHPGTPVGVAALGTWVDLQAPPGLRVPHSAEAQARHLELALSDVLDDTTTAARALFVDRWQDVLAATPSAAYTLDYPRLRPFGLHTIEGEPRPAFNVVKGFYTGQQRAFAFPSGEPQSDRRPWLILLGWGMVVLLGTSYALSPRFRHMVPRYFVGHNFYQDAVREGRDQLLVPSVVLLLALGTATGLLAYITLETTRSELAFAALFSWLTPQLRELIVLPLSEPWTLIALVGSLDALLVVVWAAVLTAISQRRHALTPGQALILALWPRWPHLVVLAAAMAIPSLPEAAALPAVGVLILYWLLVGLTALIRTAFDFMAVTRVPFYLAAAGALANPAVLLLLGSALALLFARPEFEYLRRLLP